MKTTAVLSLLLISMNTAFASSHLAADRQGRLIEVTTTADETGTALVINEMDAFGDAIPKAVFHTTAPIEIAHVSATPDDRVVILGTFENRRAMFFTITIDEDGLASAPVIHEGLGQPMNLTVNAWGELEVLVLHNPGTEKAHYGVTVLDTEGVLIDEVHRSTTGTGGDTEDDEDETDEAPIPLDMMTNFDPPPEPPPAEDPNG